MSSLTESMGASSKSVGISLPEGPLELLFGSSRTRDINSQKELFEVDVSVLVGIEGSEYVIAKLLCVSTGEKHLVHVDELDGR